MKLKIGKNTIFYGQDFGWGKGVPAGSYKVKKNTEDKIQLTAPGYGEKGNYGNGSLFVLISELPKKVQEKIREKLDEL